MTINDYIEFTYPYVCSNVVYDNVMANPDTYRDDAIRTSGRVFQVIKKDDKFDYIVLGDSKFRSMGAVIFKNEYYTEINKYDYIEILCVVKGTDKRTTVSGYDVELPLVYIARVLNK